jgi:short-subunit dehydrogenase
MLSEQSAESMRREMNVNVFGTLAMIQAFAPILAKNGGGAIANMLSVVSWFTYPFNATYCASKHAALAVTDAARIQLKAQGTQVLAVYAGFIDTDMASELVGAGQPKTSPRQVAERTLQGIRDGIHHVRADKQSEETWDSVRKDPEGLEKSMQQAWDNR